jgi:hypothetical protein
MRLVFEIFPSFCYRRTRNQILQLLLHRNYVVAVLPTGFGKYRSFAKANGTVDSVYRPPPACAWNYRTNFSLFLIIFIICHYLSLFLILLIETFKYYHCQQGIQIYNQIFEIKSRTSLMIGRHLFGMHSEISEFDMCKFENNGVNMTKKLPEQVWIFNIYSDEYSIYVNLYT